MKLNLVLTAIFVFLNGFFVAAEFALVKTRPSRVKSLAESGDRRAKRLLKILDELDLYLSSCQLGITIASLVLGYLAEPAFASLIEMAVVALGWAPPDSRILHVVAFGAALTVVTILHMVLGEQAPKIWAIHSAEKASLRFALPLRIFTVSFRPLIVVVNAMSNALLRLWGVKGGHDEHAHDSRELKAIIGAAAMSGNISSRQRMFAENIIDLVDLEVRHIMLPRTRVAYLDVKVPAEESLERIRTEGHSRWPLTDGDLDHVLGIVLARDVLEHLIGGKKFELKEIARPTHSVPDTQPLSKFIVESQQTGHQAALVHDEHGTVVGMAFLEDALEEIVGPLHDERDEAEPQVEHLEDGAILLPGSLDLPEASHVLDISFEDDHDTISGVIIQALGRLPRKGDVVKIDGYDAEVIRTGRGRSVGLVKLTPRVEEEDE